eukprot:g1982.t1
MGVRTVEHGVVRTCMYLVNAVGVRSNETRCTLGRRVGEDRVQISNREEVAYVSPFPVKVAEIDREASAAQNKSALPEARQKSKGAKLVAAFQPNSIRASDEKNGILELVAGVVDTNATDMHLPDFNSSAFDMANVTPSHKYFFIEARREGEKVPVTFKKDATIDVVKDDVDDPDKMGPVLASMLSQQM